MAIDDIALAETVDTVPVKKRIPGLITDTSTISVTTPFQAPQGAKEIDDAAKQAEALEMGIVEATGKSFTSGGNAAVQFLYDIDRMNQSGPVDPEWRDAGKAEAWIKDNSALIPANQAWRYRQTKNSVEAQMLLDDAVAFEKEQQRLARRFEIAPISTFTAMGLSGIIDVDAPITLFTGGLSAGAKLGINATKIGRLMSGAAAGALTGVAVQGVAFGSNPNEDWHSIPVAGLAGAAFGTFGGALSRGPVGPAGVTMTPELAANAARIKALDEFGTTVSEGAPLSKRDIRQEPVTHTDPYGSQRAVEQEIADREAATAAEASGAPKVPGAPEPRPSPTAVPLDEVLEDTLPEDLPTLEGRSTVGARQMNTTGPGIASIRSTRSVDMIQNARTRNQQTGVSRDWNDNYSQLNQKQDGVAKAATRFHDFITATPLVTDFGRFMRSGSVVAQMLVYDLLENASGIIRNNRSAAALMDQYQKDMLGNFLPYHDFFDEWAGRVKQASLWQKIVQNDIRDEFNTAVIRELQERNYGTSKGQRFVDPSISGAADAIDRAFAKEIEINQGRPGEGVTKGYETMQAKSGYFPQKWLGGKMQKLINSGKYGAGDAGKKAIINAVAESYIALHPRLSKKDAQIWASAVVDRALHSNEGISMNLVGILKDNDGRKAIEDLMIRNGSSKHEVDRLIDKLTGTKEEAGRAGHTKNRMDADLRFIASNGVALMDLVDTDINKIMAMRSRKAAGSAALARKGIYSRADIEAIKEAILQEQIANGPTQLTGDITDDFLNRDRHLTPQDIDDLFSYFLGQPIAGGISPVYSRMRKLTNLSLLNQLGLTQMAEFGPMIAAVGWKEFLNKAGKEIIDGLRNADSPLVAELKHMNIFVPEEKMFRDDLTFEYEKLSGTTSEYMKGFDNFLNKAQRLQGYTSGFYAVRKLQQRIAVTSMADKLAKVFSDKLKMSDDRLRDIGIDPAIEARIKPYFNNGTVEFTGGGDLFKLNLDQWKSQDAEDFILALNRNSNQMVQKAMAGESNFIFHRDGLASLFWHLKSFPMLAMEKQTYRNARLADGQAMATFTYGLMTAAAAYTVKQTINGRTDNLDPVNVAKQAFGMSNMTGWLPMWTDPLAGMLGLDSWKLNNFGTYGTSVITTPAALGVLDRMVQAPASATKILNPFSDLENSDIRNLQAIPIIGNAYGFTLMFNAMKDSIRLEKKREQSRRARERQKAPAEAAPSGLQDQTGSVVEEITDLN